MKKLILSWGCTLLLILLGLAQQAQAQCTSSNQCFDFTFLGAENLENDYVRLSFRIKTNCSNDLSYAAFELPNGAGVTSNAVSYASEKYNYKVENGTNNPFYSIKFEGVGINGYKNGATDVFTFDVSAFEFSTMRTLRVAAKASTTVGMVTFDLAKCGVLTGGDGSTGGNTDGNNGGGKGKNNAGKGNDNNGGVKCNTSQPSDILGPANPCPGDVVTYCIKADSKYTSYVWDVPRAHAGNAPSGWEIISGQGTNCVTVRVGMKPGTMKVKVNHADCGTKVRTKPVHPGKKMEVVITGPAQFCQGDVLKFEADVEKVKANGNGNGNAGNKKSFDYDWSVPAGWEIVSGQGTDLLIVKAGNTTGEVSVSVSSNQKKNNKICGAGYDAIPVTKKPNCSPCTKPDLQVNAPDEVCPSPTKNYTFSVKNPDAAGKIKYQFFLPDEFEVVSQAYGSVTVKVNAPVDTTLYVTVVAVNANNCGAEAVCLPVKVVECENTCPTGAPQVTLVAPDTVCNLSDDTYRFEVANVQEGVTYEFQLPEGFIPVDEGNGYVEVVAIFEEDQLGQPLTVRVIATSECGTTTREATVVVADCGAGTPLPVSLTRFEGVSRNGAVELVWTTATEINNDRFEIERSANGKDFVKVGEVKGSGNTSVIIDYAFTDRSAAKGTAYYRLRQVDLDGTTEYSKVISVNNAGGAEVNGAAKVSVFPNPVTNGNVNIRFAELPKGTVNVRLVDLSGRVLHTGAMNADGTLNLTGLGLSQGIYMISITADGVTETQRLVVR
ncbi:hypothetical protein FHS90_003294 [Rufibacter quisquiliarum]|uniref:Secretion system C-terminal sorting domain-containing protein n=1 Tax=Rufibacter quisquiliarum TaxID=1549639 RepID=A0A839GFY0_9BACT|nr:hypothetical protein [Rufibacter quisquiliarum]